MNLLALRTALRARVGNPTILEVPDLTLDGVINEAVTDITEKYRFHKARKTVTFPTVVDQSRYTLPSDCVAVFKVRDPLENYNLRKRTEAWAMEYQTSESGRPLGYICERDWIRLMPAADSVRVLELFYKAKAPTLVADLDEPVYPSTWDNGTLYLARYKYWDAQGDLMKATFAHNAWKLWVQDKPSEIAEEHFQDNEEGVELPGLRRRGYRHNSSDIDNW